MERRHPPLVPLVRRIEEVSLNAWPCLQQILYDGWLLRFARGYTKRANSVNALWPSTLEIETKIAFCTAQYRTRALPTIFRITPFAQPVELDQMLAERGYLSLDPTAVMYQALPIDLGGGNAGLSTAATGRHQEELDRWLAIFSQLQGEMSLHRQGMHRDILSAILGQRFLALLTVDGCAVACGLGVLEETYLGLFDLLVDARYRRQGHGTALVKGMLAWGQRHGARHAYLQVTLANVVACSLYEKLGFEELYRYWYRISED